jgi:hypothetical protein
MRTFVAILYFALSSIPVTAQPTTPAEKEQKVVSAENCKEICRSAKTKKLQTDDGAFYLQCFFAKYCDPPNDGTFIGHVPTRRGVDG